VLHFILIYDVIEKVERQAQTFNFKKINFSLFFLLDKRVVFWKGGEVI